MVILSVLLSGIRVCKHTNIIKNRSLVVSKSHSKGNRFKFIQLSLVVVFFLPESFVYLHTLECKDTTRRLKSV